MYSLPMLGDNKISRLKRSSELHLSMHQYCLSIMIHLRQIVLSVTAVNVQGLSIYKITFEDVLNHNAIQNITFEECNSTVAIVKLTEEFTESLFEKLLLLLCRTFTATHQVMPLKELNCYLQSDEFVVFCNFIENYSFTSQDEIQRFHWNNAQATIHPSAMHFKTSDALIQSMKI
jgi:hypothetical protein